MAVKNLDNYTNAEGFGLPLNIRRGNPNPLDNSYLWNSYEELSFYAATSPIAYVGQLVAAYQDVEVEKEDGTKETVKSVCLYIITDEAGDLLLVANLKTATALNVDLDKIKEKVEQTQQKQEELQQKQEETSQKQEEIAQKQEETSQKQDELQQKQEEIVQKQEETDKKQEELQQKQKETAQKQEELQQKQEEQAQKQEELQQKQEEADKKQEEIIKKQEETDKKQEELEQKQEDIQKELEQNIKDTVDKVVEEQQKENENIKKDQEDIKTDIGQTTDPETGESKLPEDATDIVDAINKVNDKIVDPREDEDQWATEEDIDNLYEDLFGDLGW